MFYIYSKYISILWEKIVITSIIRPWIYKVSFLFMNLNCIICVFMKDLLKLLKHIVVEIQKRAYKPLNGNPHVIERIVVITLAFVMTGLFERPALFQGGN